MRSEHKRQGKGQDRGYFASYLSLFTTCNFIVGYLQFYRGVPVLYSSTGRQSPQFGGEGEIQQCGAGTRGG